MITVTYPSSLTPTPPARRAIMLLAAALGLNGIMSGSSPAQVVALSAPAYNLIDENGVDLLTQNVYLHQTVLSIGSADHPFAETIRSGPDGDWYDIMTSYIGAYSPSAQPFVSPPDEFAPAFIGPGIPAVRGNPYGIYSCGYPAWEDSEICAIVTTGAKSEPFVRAGTITTPAPYVYTAVEPTGSTFSAPSSAGMYYTEHDGTVTTFAEIVTDRTVATQTAYPDGRILQYWYGNEPDGTMVLTAVTRNDGLELHFAYAGVDSVSGPNDSWQASSVPTGQEGVISVNNNVYTTISWVVASVTAINTAYDYCNPSAIACTTKLSWPTANFSWSPTSDGALFAVTDSLGRVTDYYMNLFRTEGIKLPSSTGDENITYTYCNFSCSWAPSYGYNYGVDFVSSVTRNGQTWNYVGNVLVAPGAPPSGSTRFSSIGVVQFTSTSPVGATQSVVDYNCYLIYETAYAQCLNPLIQYTNKQGEQFDTVDDGMEIGNTVMPEQNGTQYSWNAAGDLTQEVHSPKPGSPLAPVTLSADYTWAGCNSLTCNEPDWVKDGRQNQTNYTYNPNNGEVATATLPPDGNGNRPQTNYTYAQQYAYALNSTGQYVASATPIWVRSTESFCRTSPATTDLTTGQVDCAAGASDKVLRTFYYGPATGPNNLFLRGDAVTATDNGVTVTRVTCYGYDRFGNRISVTTPNAGLTSCP